MTRCPVPPLPSQSRNRTWLPCLRSERWSVDGFCDLYFSSTDERWIKLKIISKRKNDLIRERIKETTDRCSRSRPNHMVLVASLTFTHHHFV